MIRFLISQNHVLIKNLWNYVLTGKYRITIFGENITESRFGEKISNHGFGGKITESCFGGKIMESRFRRKMWNRFSGKCWTSFLVRNCEIVFSRKMLNRVFWGGGGMRIVFWRENVDSRFWREMLNCVFGGKLLNCVFDRKLLNHVFDETNVKSFLARKCWIAFWWEYVELRFRRVNI